MKAYAAISGLLFGALATLQGTRLWQHWPVQVNGSDVPMWVSWIMVTVAGCLCIWGLRLCACTKPVSNGTAST